MRARETQAKGAGIWWQLGWSLDRSKALNDLFAMRLMDFGLLLAYRLRQAGLARAGVR